MNNQEVLKPLKEESKWLRFLAWPQLTKLLEENLRTTEQKRAYQLSDGKNSTREISKKLSEGKITVSPRTVYNYWKRWAHLGIVVPCEQYSGRFQKIIDLEDLSIHE